jgi:hypothetical protein
MTEFTFRMKKGEAEASDSDEESRLQPSTAAPSSSSQDTDASKSAISTEMSSQELMYRFSGMKMVGESLTRATTEDGEDQAAAEQAMSLEEAEQLLRGKNQVPLKGKEFLKYKAPTGMWHYCVHYRSYRELFRLLTWKSSPGLLAQDFEDERGKYFKTPEDIAEATCIWHRLDGLKEEDWNSFPSFEEYRRYVDPTLGGSLHPNKRQCMW